MTHEQEGLARHFLGTAALAGAFDFSMEPVYREAALIAFHFHWSRRECLSLSRRERRVWLEEIRRINQEIARSMKGKGR